MQPLSTLDTLIFALDHKKFPMHGSAVMILDPATSAEHYTFENFCEHVRRLLPKMPPMRRRLVRVPLGLSAPLWAEDPQFDLRRHIHHATLPAPGSRQELARLNDEVSHRPVDWDRPLWDMWFVDGLADGKIGFIFQIHHCIADLSSGNDMIAQLFGSQANSPAAATPDSWVAEQIPNRRELLVKALPSLIRFPATSAYALVQLVRAVSRAKQVRSSDGTAAPKAPLFRGVRLPFNRIPKGIPHKTTGWATVSMSDVHAIRRIHGGTVNDVGIAIYAGLLRRWLIANGNLPPTPLTCSIAKNVRPDSEAGVINNVFDVMALSLPTDVADAAARLRSVVRVTSRAKAQVAASNTNIVENAFRLVTPGIAKGSLAAGMAILGKRMPVPYNTSVTCARASDEPVYLAGARVEDYFVPIPLSAGVGLMCSVVTYNGTMYLTAVGHHENVPDIWSLIAGVDEQVEELLHPVASGAGI